MELEKIANELACKAVAARNSDSRIQPGQYADWASEFKKLAEEHYVEVGLQKESALSDYNPYAMYDKAVSGKPFMSNELVRNALVTGGLGAGVGALGSLTSNFFSKKKKKNYLSDALSSGVLGGLAGGLGGAGYTTIKNPDIIPDAIAAFTGKDERRPKTDNPSLEDEVRKIDEAGNTMPKSKSMAITGAGLGIASLPSLYAMGRNLFNSGVQTRGNIPRILENAEVAIARARDSLSTATRPTFDKLLSSVGYDKPGSLRYGTLSLLFKNLNNLSDRIFTAPYTEIENVKKEGKPTKTYTNHRISVPLNPQEINDVTKRIAGLPVGGDKPSGVLQGFGNEGKIISDRVTSLKNKQPNLGAAIGTELAKGDPSTRKGAIPKLISKVTGGGPNKTRAYVSPKGLFTGVIPKSWAAIPTIFGLGVAGSPALISGENPEARAGALSNMLQNMLSQARASTVLSPDAKKNTIAFLTNLLGQVTPEISKGEANNILNQVNENVYKKYDTRGKKP